MNADDPILKQRRCDARVPQLGIVCELPAGHDGEHGTTVDSLELMGRLARQGDDRMLELTMDALTAARRYADVLERGNARLRRWHRVDGVMIAVLMLVDVLLLGLRLVGA